MTPRRLVKSLFSSGFLLLLCAGCTGKAPAPEEREPEPIVDLEHADPFALGKADDDATRYEDLAEIDRANVDDIEEWAETTSGPVSADAWSVYAAEVARDAIAASEVVR